MRIVGGLHRGRRFNPPKFFKARPTTDFAKESLFNLLNNRIDLESKKALDLFSGTGSISYEFMSRGCSYVMAVDISEKYLSYIEKTSKLLNPDEKVVRTYKANVFTLLNKLELDYDVIFADPPYDIDKLETLPDLIFGNDTLKKDAIIIIEHSLLNNFSKHPHFQEKRVYGKVNFSFFQ
ncbi:MAG: 16S rRNA (guanine(966)-N(2))-methyltransferase RsmD [Bacteroidetes bacterium]|nr:MAG: 16S rRNA (guanine(966)-N(2))-methyltransferase RsmD [Bacteroidota bacterium]